MAEFVTISLENNECDICHHDNGEDLISYFLNDRCLRQQEIWSIESKSSNYGKIHKAHLLCLDRWDHIMKKSFNRFCPLRRSWTSGKQSCSLTKVNSSSHENLIISRTWTAIKSHSQEKLNSDTFSNRSVPQNPIQIPKYLEDTHSRPSVRRDTKHGGHKDVDGNLARFSVDKLQEKISDHNKKIKDASAELISLLQERDGLNQEIEVRRVAIEQLLKLQTCGGRSQSVVTNTELDANRRNSLRV